MTAKMSAYDPKRTSAVSGPTSSSLPVGVNEASRVPSPFVGGAAAWPLAVALLLDRQQIGTHRPRFLLTELDGGHVGMARRDSTL
jgi:hypothetical protein